MKVRDLRSMLQEGAAATSADARGLADALQPLDEMTFDEFANLVSTAAGKLKKPSAAKSTALNEVGVTRYLDELGNTRADNAAFEAVIKTRCERQNHQSRGGPADSSAVHGRSGQTQVKG